MKIDNMKSTPLLGGFSRAGSFPIDDSSKFDTRRELDSYLASTTTTAYKGQIVAVVEEDTIYCISAELSAIPMAKLSDIKTVETEISDIIKTLDEAKQEINNEVDRKIEKEISDREKAVDAERDARVDAINQLTLDLKSEESERKLADSQLETAMAGKASQETVLSIVSDVASNKTKIDSLDEKINHVNDDLSKDIVEINNSITLNKTELTTNLDSLTSRVNDIKKTVDGILHQADTDFDTFEEVAKWIKDNKATIEQLQEAIKTIDAYTKAEIEAKLADYAKKSDLPTRTSQLANDSGYLTQHQDISGKADKKDVYSRTEVDQLIADVEGGAGTNVIANEPLTGDEEDLTSVKIGVKNYKIAGAADLAAIKASLGQSKEDSPTGESTGLFKRVDNLETSVGDYSTETTTISNDLKTIKTDIGTASSETTEATGIYAFTENLETSPDYENFLLISGGNAYSYN